MLSVTLAVDCTRPDAPGCRLEEVSGLDVRRATGAPGVVQRGIALSRADEPAVASCERPTPTQPSSERSVHRVGDVIARKYRLRAVIGEGGMGTVWAARNEDLELDVAIKMVHRHSNVEETTRRLLAEARAEARIEHPGVVRVLDVSATRWGDSFLVMELLRGRSLGNLLHDTGMLPPQVAVKILLPVVDALAHAHEKGVVHRDLKPDNIFLAESGGRIQPKVVDFGIAQLREQRPSTTPPQPGIVVGTPGYMAPEQACGGGVDGRADVWALSVVLYEALTGKSAFAATSDDATLGAVVERNLLPITELGIGDAGLWRILEHGLQKNKRLRLPSMRALGRALAQWLVQQGETTDITGESVSDTWLALPAERHGSASDIKAIRRSPGRRRSFVEGARVSMLPRQESLPSSATPAVIVARRRRADHWALIGLAIAAGFAITPAPGVRMSERLGATAGTEMMSSTFAPAPEPREQVPERVPALSTDDDVTRAAAIPTSTPARSRPRARVATPPVSEQLPRVALSSHPPTSQPMRPVVTQPQLLRVISTPARALGAEELKNPYL